MAPAVGKKSIISLSLFIEAFGLEVEDLSTFATQYWAEGVWIGKWHHGQKGGLDESDLRGSDVEASERTNKSGYVRNQRFGHQVTAMAHLDI